MSFSSVEKVVLSSIEMAVRGGIRNPQEGVDYLPKTLDNTEGFDAHTWVKNAVLLGYMLGLSQGANNPVYAPSTLELAGVGADVLSGGNAFGMVQSFAREG